MSPTENLKVFEKPKTTPVPETRGNDNIPNHQFEPIVNLDTGDPTMYEKYWKEVGQKYESSITIPAFQSLSYFANAKNFCWFMEPKLEEEIKRLHHTVGNAVVDGRHIVVGTGSSQLILAVLYALADTLNDPNPVSVVSATPYYSSHPEMANFLRSGLFKWCGDARSFHKAGPYIEMVTCPNNPDGVMREPVVNRTQGMLIHDMAYYWPQYTPITSRADHDIMLFTISKCTGHAGSRIGWAIVRDEKVARKMVKFLELSSIGVSKEAQLRAANILKIVSFSCQNHRPRDLENFFEYNRHLMVGRWKRLRDALKNNELFHVPKFPLQHCKFTKDFTEACPAFAWVKCKEGIDCEKLLRERKIATRGGTRFGSDAEHVRISLLSTDQEFDLFVQRLSTIRDIANGN